MFTTAVVLFSAAMAALVAGQNGSSTIDPNSVTLSLRQSWCRAQTANCPPICNGAASPNSCDPSTLSYQCVCSDGSKPNISDFQQTLPFYICQQSRDQCVQQHPNDLDGQTNCLAVQCGQKNATSQSASASGGSSSATATSGSSTASQTASASASGTTAAKSSAAAVPLEIASGYGTGILAVGLFAIFGLAL